jgi:hypothetical protein
MRCEMHITPLQGRAGQTILMRLAGVLPCTRSACKHSSCRGTYTVTPLRGSLLPCSSMDAVTSRCSNSKQPQAMCMCVLGFFICTGLGLLVDACEPLSNSGSVPSVVLTLRSELQIICSPPLCSDLAPSRASSCGCLCNGLCPSLKDHNHGFDRVVDLAAQLLSLPLLALLLKPSVVPIKGMYEHAHPVITV